MSEKNEKPTSKRLRDARKKGQIAKSVELTSASQLLCIASILAYFSSQWLEDIISLISLTFSVIPELDYNEIKKILFSSAALFIKIIGVCGGLTLIITIAVQFSQVGAVIATDVYKESAQRINPMKNLKQIFSFASVFELLKSILKLLVVGAIFSFILRTELINIQNLSSCSALCALYFNSGLLSKLFVGLLSAYVFFAIMDFSFQKRKITKQLMMSKEEIKQEYKESEGNQEVKQHRKDFQRELLQGELKKNVRKSSFIIRNPTHVAVCIRYDARLCPLPMVLDKGFGNIATEIIELAESENIPMVENIKLARRLFREIPRGQFITEAFYDDVAAIIHIVDKLPKIKANFL